MEPNIKYAIVLIHDRFWHLSNMDGETLCIETERRINQTRREFNMWLKANFVIYKTFRSDRELVYGTKERDRLKKNNYKK